jgi:signal transduction histidine kinase
MNSANLAIRAMDVLYSRSWPNRLADGFGRTAGLLKSNYTTGKARKKWASMVSESLQPPHLQLNVSPKTPLDHGSFLNLRKLFPLVQGGEISVVEGEKDTPPKAEFVGEAMLITLTKDFLSNTLPDELQNSVSIETQRLLRKKSIILELLGFGHDEENSYSAVGLGMGTTIESLTLLDRSDLIGNAHNLLAEFSRSYSASVLSLKKTLDKGSFSSYADFINSLNDNDLEKFYKAFINFSRVLEPIAQWLDLLKSDPLDNLSKIGKEIIISIGTPLSAISDLSKGAIDSIEGRTTFTLVNLRDELQKYIETVKIAKIQFEDRLGPYPLVRINVHRLKRLLDNLIKDAAQAVLDQGCRSTITIFASVLTGKVRLIIQDTGPAGIPSAFLEETIDYRGKPVQKIFTPGVRRIQNDARESLASAKGLGKTIVHRIAEEFGGWVSASNIFLPHGKIGGEFVIEF